MMYKKGDILRSTYTQPDMDIYKVLSVNGKDKTCRVQRYYYPKEEFMGLPERYSWAYLNKFFINFGKDIEWLKLLYDEWLQ